MEAQGWIVVYFARHPAPRPHRQRGGQRLALQHRDHRQLALRAEARRLMHGRSPVERFEAPSHGRPLRDSDSEDSGWITTHFQLRGCCARLLGRSSARPDFHLTGLAAAILFNHVGADRNRSLQGPSREKDLSALLRETPHIRVDCLGRVEFRSCWAGVIPRMGFRLDSRNSTGRDSR
jgi:hypothetical protein